MYHFCNHPSDGFRPPPAQLLLYPLLTERREHFPGEEVFLVTAEQSSFLAAAGEVSFLFSVELGCQ